MLRTSFFLCCASVAVAAVALNCGADDTPVTTQSDAGLDARTAADTAPVEPPPDAPGPQPEAGPVRAIYAVDDANQLVRLTAQAPGTASAMAITGLDVGESVHGIDFRPKTGALYALGSSGKVYTVAKATGVATAVAGDPGVTTFPLVLDPTATSFGFDFNPVADRIRVHTNTGKNYRLHPTDGRSVNAAGDPDLAYVGGGAVSIVGTAYTNSVSAQPAATALYGIDSQRDLLVSFAGPPGFAEVTPVGALGVDAQDVAGFDIYGGMGGGDGGPVVDKPREAYAALTVGGATGLYRIDIATGAATIIGAIGHPKPLRGIAVEP